MTWGGRTIPKRACRRCGARIAVTQMRNHQGGQRCAKSFAKQLDPVISLAELREAIRPGLVDNGWEK